MHWVPGIPVQFVDTIAGLGIFAPHWLAICCETLVLREIFIMYAVIRTGGKQYRVAQKDVVRVERVSAEVGNEVDLDEVLMLGDGTSTTVGTPLIEGARVTAQVIDQIRAPKITVFKKRRRKNHRRTKGHRQALTVLRITEIGASGAVPRKVQVEKQPQQVKKADEGKKETPSEGKTTAKKPSVAKVTPDKATKKVSTVKKAASKADDVKDNGGGKKKVAKKAAPKAKKKPVGGDKPAKPKTARTKKAKDKEEND